MKLVHFWIKFMLHLCIFFVFGLCKFWTLLAFIVLTNSALKYLLLCSSEGFGMTWRGVNDDRMLFFWSNSACNSGFSYVAWKWQLQIPGEWEIWNGWVAVFDGRGADAVRWAQEATYYPKIWAGWDRRGRCWSWSLLGAMFSEQAGAGSSGKDPSRSWEKPAPRSPESGWEEGKEWLQDREER